MAPQGEEGDEEEQQTRGGTNTYHPFYNPVIHPRTVEVYAQTSRRLVLSRPLLGPFLFDNTDSDARDHCANERTFLSYLRLSLYMTIVSVAIVISFHLKTSPTEFELRLAKPLGIVFWCLSLCCLVLGFGNYVKTVERYGRRAAIVQHGWKTQSILITIAISIVGVCILFLATRSTKG